MLHEGAATPPPREARAPPHKQQQKLTNPLLSSEGGFWVIAGPNHSRYLVWQLFTEGLFSAASGY